jgi:hypothetical protein
MSDPFEGLPQTPRPDDHVIQLDPEGLDRLFAESCPQPRAIEPKAARVAVMMHKAGRDPAAIARRVGAAPSAVSEFLRRLASQEPPVADRLLLKPSQRGRREPQADALKSPGQLETPSAPRESADTRPDIELTSLQLNAVRLMRKGGVSARTISRMTKIPHDQVLRITGEAP